MVVYLRTPELEINIETFKLILHLHYILICNGFGIAD
jgi:hypothetical protein